MIISKSFKHFEYIKFISNFLEKERLFQKAGVPFFSWNHVDWNHIISIQNCFIRSQWNANRMAATKWTYHKEWSFVSNYFFWKICFRFRTSQKGLIWCTNHPNIIICIFRKHWSLFLGRFFPVSILRNNCLEFSLNIMLRLGVIHLVRTQNFPKN